MSMIERQSCKIIRCWILFASQILVLSVESYNLKCPSPAHWKFRAKVKCNSTLKYFCLYNIVKGRYDEGCTGPDWDRKGSKRIYAGDFSRGYCFQDRFQPFRFWTNGSMTDCIFAKSICSEEGQLIYEDDSTKDDRACRCDHKKNYSFTKAPRNNCFCIPSEEDCSCNIKSCPVNQTLSADYICIHRSYDELLSRKCKDIKEFNKTVVEKTVRCTDNTQLCYSKPTLRSKWPETATTTILVCLCIIHIVAGYFFAVLFPEWTIKKLHPLTRYIQRKRKGSSLLEKDKKDVDEVSWETMETVSKRSHLTGECTTLVDTEQIRLTLDEVNYLRLIHILFRVACPVVRMTFNHEIHPDQLRRTLDKNMLEIKKKYRMKRTIFDDYQWHLLFGHSKGKTVTSEDFGIRLMTYLLHIIANIDVSDLYPVHTDTSIGAMLSRIKFIRNEVTQSLEGYLTKDQFSKYWDDIGQAVLKLVSSLEVHFENDKKNEGLIDRLCTLNPISINTRELYFFIDMSEIYHSMILRKLISEYCTMKKVTIEDILKDEKHDLYHKRIKTESCCKCSTKQSSTFVKVISEKQWDALYEISLSSNSHSCQFNLKKCSERFVPKTINTSDLSVIMTLVLYSTNIMHYIVSRLFSKGFMKFLLDHQHTLYHSMDKKMCCKCRKSPTEEILINHEEWNTLFIKEKDILCKNNTTDCCCQYSVIRRIKYSDIDETVLFKIVYLAGPIGVLNRINENAFLYFIKWTVNADPIRRALTELLNIIEDKTFRSDILRRTSSFNLSQSYATETKFDDACEWLSKHLRKQKATTEPPLQFCLRDKDALLVRSVHIPHEFTLPPRTRLLTDITSEENNFLVVVHGLSKIVYPIVINEFNTHCRHHMLEAIRRDIFEQQCKTQNHHKHRDQRRRMYLSHKQQKQLFSPRKEESKILDLKLMIYILKENSNEEKKEYVKQLDVIDSIRREIVQSSSGVLNDKQFKDILERIHKAVSYLGGERYMDELASLQCIQNILDQ